MPQRQERAHRLGSAHEIGGEHEDPVRERVRRQGADPRGEGGGRPAVRGGLVDQAHGSRPPPCAVREGTRSVAGPDDDDEELDPNWERRRAPR